MDGKIKLLLALVLVLQGCTASRAQKDQRDNRNFDADVRFHVRAIECELIEIERSGKGGYDIDQGRTKDDKSLKLDAPKP